MKKVIYGGLFLTLVGISIVGCKKESFQSVDKKGAASETSQLKSMAFRTDGRLLIFNTVADFDAAIEQSGADLYSQLQALDFKSYAETIVSQNENEIEDEFLSNVLNNDLAVQIGNYIYKIDKPNRIVYALPVSETSSYADLIAKNTSNKYVLTFSTEDNVFELLGEVSDTGKSISQNCRDSKTGGNEWVEYANYIDEDNVYGNGTDKRYKFERNLKVRYDNWGILRKLFTEFKHNEKWYGLWDETYFTIAYQVSYQVKGGGSGTQSHFPTYPFATTDQTVNVSTSSYEYNDDEKVIEHYKGTKCLKAYDLKSWCWMRNRQTLKHNLVPSEGYYRIHDNLDVW